MKKVKLLAATAMVVILAHGPAQAKVYNWSFDGGASASGTLMTSNTVNAIGGYDVRKIGGTVGAAPVTGIIANPNAPYNATCCGFYYDNVVFDAAPHVDIAGLLFKTSDTVWNIYSANNTVYLLGNGPTGYTPDGWGYTGALTLSAVPEPMTWAMLIAGFGMVGATLRRRSTTVKFAVA